MAENERIMFDRMLNRDRTTSCREIEWRRKTVENRSAKPWPDLEGWTYVYNGYSVSRARARGRQRLL